MKKILTIAVAVLLVSGTAFAGNKTKKEGKSCSKECKKEGKSCSKDKKG